MQGQGALSGAFVAGLAPGTPAPAGDLEGDLRVLVDSGRAAWPDLALDEQAFARHLARMGTKGDPALPGTALAADVFLACACAAGVAGAVAAFDKHLSGAFANAVRRIDPSPAFLEDVRQGVWEKLFVAKDGAAAKITEYAGRAPLRVWLRAVAVRAALNLRRARSAEPHEDVDDARLHDPGSDPEIGLMKARYKAELEAAARVAVRRLSVRERTILRLHLVDGLSVDVLGAHYGVGRSTAARWLAAARDALREHARSELTARLGLSRSELRSVAALVRSQVEVSARGLLGEAEEGA